MKSISSVFIVAVTTSSLLLSQAWAFQAAAPKNVHRSSTSQLFSTEFQFTASVDHSQNLVNVQEGAPRDIPSMDTWAEACGVQKCDGFQLVPTPMTTDYGGGGDDISVMTNQDLPAGSPVLFVPGQMILSSKQTEAELSSYVQDALGTIQSSLTAKQQTQYFYLMLKVLVEYENGQESPWFPWLNSMPRYFTNGASMTSFCYECLPPLVRSLAMQERANWRTLYSAMKLVPFLSEVTKNNKELCKWAFQIAYTRSYAVDTTENAELKIIPMADYLNHGSYEPELSSDISYDEQGNAILHTNRDVPAGSPLRISYGDPANPSFLLARYGFLDESSPATFCKIMIPRPDNQLLRMGYSHTKMLFYKDSGEVSPQVFDVLLYQHLLNEGGSENPDLQTLVRAHNDGDEETKNAMHQHYWPQTSSMLYNHIEEFLVQLEELQAKGNGKDIREHPRLPLIQQHNEFVRNTFLAVRQRYFS